MLPRRRFMAAKLRCVAPRMACRQMAVTLKWLNGLPGGQKKFTRKAQGTKPVLGGIIVLNNNRREFGTVQNCWTEVLSCTSGTGQQPHLVHQAAVIAPEQLNFPGVDGDVRVLTGRILQIGTRKGKEMIATGS